jgi:tetratricopeptide (TPR) repeat protein
MQLQVSLAGAVLFARGVMPEVMTAANRALEIASALGDTDYHLRCLRMIASFEFWNGRHDAAVQALETFISIAAERDPSALHVGETHHALGDIFTGRLSRARQRLERLNEEQTLPDFEGSQFVRFLYSKTVDVLNLLSFAQWLTGATETAERTATRLVEYAQQTKHATSISNALMFSTLVFFLNGNDEKAAKYSAMFEDHVLQHGILIWQPDALFYRGALLCMEGKAPQAGLDCIERAIGDLGAINSYARMPFYLAKQALFLNEAGHHDKAYATIQTALERAHLQNERWCLPEVLRVRAAIMRTLGQMDEAEQMLQSSIAIADEIGALPWKLKSANDLARLMQAQSRMASAGQLLKPIVRSFSEGFSAGDLRAAAVILGEA